MAGGSMSSATLYTGITEAKYAAIIHEVVEAALWDKNVVKKLCRQEDISGQPSRAFQLNFWDANTAAAALTETEDLTNTALTLASVTLTTAEVGAMTTLSDWLLETSIGMMREVTSYGTQLGMSIADKIDTDLTSLFSALNGGTAAGAGTADTDVLDAIADAHFILDANNAEGVDRSCVLHSEQISTLRKQVVRSEKTIFHDWASKTGMYQDANGYVGTMLNADLFMTNNVKEVTGAKRGAMVVPGKTLAYVEKRGVRPFTERDESLRATEVGATLAYAVGEIRDKNGCAISTNSTTSD